MMLRIATFCVVLVVLLAFANAKSFQNTNEVVYFPNPNGDGTLIPAKLTPTPGAKAGDISDIHFRLYTKENPMTFDEIKVDDMESITNSHFKAGAPLKLMIHGFGGNYTHAFPWETREELVKAEMPDFNVILLDWSILSEGPDYFTAVANSHMTSKLAADLLNFLVDNDMASWETIHLIGYSLGGQVVGQVGFKVGPNKVSRISALDPALPLFDVAHDDNKTDKTDGVFVDVIHTAANGILAYWDPLGHVDFYPNGGRYQPGCGLDPTGACAHARAPAMYAESVFATDENGFWARECENYDDFMSGACDEARTEKMGYNTPKETTGIYFLQSNSESPFAKGQLTP